MFISVLTTHWALDKDRWQWSVCVLKSRACWKCHVLLTVSDVVTTRCPLPEVSWHLKDSALQGGGYAFLCDLTEYFACFMWESKVLPLRSLQSNKSPFFTSFTIMPVSRKSRVQGKSLEGDERSDILFLLIQRSCRLPRSRRFALSFSSLWWPCWFLGFKAVWCLCRCPELLRVFKNRIFRLWWIEDTAELLFASLQLVVWKLCLSHP